MLVNVTKSGNTLCWRRGDQRSANQSRGNHTQKKAPHRPNLQSAGTNHQ